MLLKALTLTFRYPKQGEFGFNHCSGKIWYATLNLEGKPISWFFDKITPSMWFNSISSTRIANNNQWVRDVSFLDYGFLKDGSYEIDDLELDINSINKAIGLDNSYLQACDIVRNLIVGNLVNSLLVVTSKLKKEDFIKELKDFLYLSTREEFDRAVDWLTKSRYDTNSFSNKKLLLEQIVPGIKTRGTVQIDLALNDYFSKKMANNAKIKLADILPFTDEELVSLFNGPDSKVLSLNKAFNIVDERSIIGASVKPISEVNDFVKVYLGKTAPGAKGSNFILVGGTSNNSEGYLKIDTLDGSMYRLSCISSIAKSNIKFNLEIGRNACESVKKKIGDNDGVYGRVASVSKEEINDVLQTVEETVNNSWGSAVSGLDLLPVMDSISFGSWYSSLSQTIKIPIAKDSIFVLVPKDKPNEDFSHEKLSVFESTLNSLATFSDPKIGKIDYTKANSPKLEERKEMIAKRLSYLYEIFREYLKYEWFVSLGCPKVDRAFIINENAQSRPIFDKTALERSSAVARTIIPRQSEKIGNIVQIYSDVEVLPYILMIKHECGTWEKAREVAIKVYNSSTKKVVSSKALFEEILSAICAEKKKSVPNVVKLDLENYSNNPKFKFKSSVGEVLVQLDFFKSHQIYEILKSASLMMMIENDTFININQSVENVLVDPYYQILSIVRDNISSSPSVIRSMYA